jgi:hypothetical protein
MLFVFAAAPQAVMDDWYFQMYYDDLPVWGFIGKVRSSSNGSSRAATGVAQQHADLSSSYGRKHRRQQAMARRQQPQLRTHRECSAAGWGGTDSAKVQRDLKQQRLAAIAAAKPGGLCSNQRAAV